MVEPFLFRAFSVIENFRGLCTARVAWVPLRAERLRFGPIEGLVADYGKLSREELSIARGYLDEFFTPVEANQLRRALEDGFGYPVELFGTRIPVSCRDGSGEMRYPFRALPESTWKGQEIVARRGKLALPFDVLALWREDPAEGGLEQ